MKERKDTWPTLASVPVVLPPKKSNKTLIVTLAIISGVLVVAVIIATVLLLSSSNQKKDIANNQINLPRRDDLSLRNQYVNGTETKTITGERLIAISNLHDRVAVLSGVSKFENLNTYTLTILDPQTNKEISRHKTLGCAQNASTQLNYVYCLSTEMSTDNQPKLDGRAKLLAIDLKTGAIKKTIVLGHEYVAYEATYSKEVDDNNEVIFFGKINPSAVPSIDRYQPIVHAISINRNKEKVRWSTDLVKEGKFNSIESCNTGSWVLSCIGTQELHGNLSYPYAASNKQQITISTDLRIATFALDSGKSAAISGLNSRTNSGFLLAHDGWTYIAETNRDAHGIAIKDSGKEFEIYNYINERQKTFKARGLNSTDPTLRKIIPDTTDGTHSLPTTTNSDMVSSYSIEDIFTINNTDRQGDVVVNSLGHIIARSINDTVHSRVVKLNGEKLHDGIAIGASSDGKVILVRDYTPSVVAQDKEVKVYLVNTENGTVIQEFSRRGGLKIHTINGFLYISDQKEGKISLILPK